MHVNILVTALEAIGEICGRRKAKTAEQLEWERILRRNERVMMFFVIFCLLVSVVLVCCMVLI